MGAFKAYDIRGVWKRDFDEETVYRIGYFLPSLLKADKVAVGRDVRLSSETIYENLTRGINDAGADVLDLGLATTPMVYFATNYLKVDALSVDLYTETMDFELMDRIGDALSAAGFVYDVNRTWITAEKMYQISFNTEVLNG